MAHQSLFRNVSGWLIRHKQRIGIILKRVGIVLAGHTAKQIEEFLFDWLLYGSVSFYCTSHLGPSLGSAATFALMAPFSAFMCLLYIKLYDWAKLDIFGFESLKGLKNLETANGSWATRLWSRIIRMGDMPAFIALSIYGDPFMVTVYLRKENQAFKGLTSRDRRIFWGSVIVSNGYWTLRWTAIFGIIRYLWSFDWAAQFTKIFG